jgi:hypothetical protein
MPARKGHETRLRLQLPFAAKCDALFAEYETHDFERSGDELYLKVLRNYARCRQLYEHTNSKSSAAGKRQPPLRGIPNRALLRPHELPDGWGSLSQWRNA